MSLNYNFVNDVSSDVMSELQRRQGSYWPDGSINDNALAWNYQKTAYLRIRAYEPTITVVKPSKPNTGQGPSIAGYTSDKSWKQYASDTNNVAAAVEIVTYELTDAIINPTAPILSLYKDNGTIRGAILNSAEITSDGTYGSILRITVNFTVFDKDELDKYIDNFLRPGQDVELEYGWTVNENIKNNRGKVRGTVYNFTFSAKEDGSWDCTLNALGPSSMTYGFNMDQHGTNDVDKDWLTSPKGKGLEALCKTILDTTDVDGDATNEKHYTDNCIRRSIADSYRIAAAGSSGATATYDGFEDIYTYIYKLPADKSIDLIARIGILGGDILNFGGNISAAAGVGAAESNNAATVQRQKNIAKNYTATNESKFSYISLRNLINLFNIIIKNSFKLNTPKYTFNGFDKDGNKLKIEICNADLSEKLKQIGPSDFTKFAFVTQTNGFGFDNLTRFNFNIGSELDPQISNRGTTTVSLPDLVLINVNFIYTEIQSLLSNKKNITNKKLITFLNNLFQQLETCTGGHIALTVNDSPKDPKTHKSEYIQILNQNYIPDDIKLDPKNIPAFTQGSVVRGLSVESSVPDAIQTEVATYTRAGIGTSYVGNDESDETVDTNLNILSESLGTLNDSFMDNINPDKAVTSTSLTKWQAQVQDIYRKMYTISQGGTLNGSKMSQYSLANLKTAIFPIKLKVTMDGIEGFLYGNAIKTNWLPKQYKKAKVYWTVIKIRHIIQNNDWITELETIYRVIT